MLSGTPRTFIGSTTFTVRGLTDVESRTTLVVGLGAVRGVRSVVADPASGVVTVTASQLVDRAEIAAALERLGFALVS